MNSELAVQLCAEDFFTRQVPATRVIINEIRGIGCITPANVADIQLLTDALPLIKCCITPANVVDIQHLEVWASAEKVVSPPQMWWTYSYWVDNAGAKFSCITPANVADIQLAPVESGR